MDQLTLLKQQLERLYKGGNFAQCSGILEKIKIHLISTDRLLPTGNKDDALVRDCLELAALCVIQNKDVDSFQRYFSQISEFPPSANFNTLTGLYLLILLCENRISDFHTHLERLGSSALSSEPIRYATELEEWLMEGSYDNIWNALKQNKGLSSEFQVFQGIIIQTMRNEIASCLEKAYSTLSIISARSLLYLEEDKELSAFASQRNWIIRNNQVILPKEEDKIMSIRDASVVNTLKYAHKVEMIV